MQHEDSSVEGENRHQKLKKPKTLKTEESATNSKPIHVLVVKHTPVIPLHYGHLMNCDGGGKTVASLWWA